MARVSLISGCHEQRLLIHNLTMFNIMAATDFTAHQQILISLSEKAPPKDGPLTH
jgi:hypothetical protein